MFGKIVANTGWLFADKILRMGGSLLVGVWIARYLGVKDFGLLNYAIAFVALFNPIALLGLDGIVVRQLSTATAKETEILGSTLCLKIAAGICCLLLSVVAIGIARPGDSISTTLVAILSLSGIAQAFDAIDFWFQSQVESKYAVIAKNTAFAIVVLLRVLAILMKASLVVFAWISVVEIVIASVGLVIVYQRRGFSMWQWRWTPQVARNLLAEGWPLIFSSLAIVIYMRIDQIMIGNIIDDRAVGIYSAAVKISEVWYFIPVSVATSVAPTIYQAKQVSKQLYYQRLERLNRSLVLLSLALTIPMIFIAQPLVTLLFGSHYLEATNILIVHIWTAIFVFTGVATSSWFTAEGLNQLSMYKTVLGALINMSLNSWLIPIYGGLGAAIATVISQACAAFFLNAVHPQTREIFYLQLRSFGIPIDRQPDGS